MKDLLSGVLEASIANPNDEYEVDLIADVASVGITDELYQGGKKIEWTEEVLAAKASTLKGMPINLRFMDDEDGKIEPHTNIVIGRVDEAEYDPKRGKVLAKGKLWRHYFPETIDQLNSMMAAEGKRPQTSIEFQPTDAEFPEEGIIRPKDGRFIGLGIVNKGADLGNFVHLLASAKEEDAKKKMNEVITKGIPLVGSYEWIGENLITHLNASASNTDYHGMNIVATYPDSAVWMSNGTFYKTPFTVDRTNIIFDDTIEVEYDFKPVRASEDISNDTVTEPQKEAIKPMAEIDETELGALKASAAKADSLQTELETLRASAEKTETELAEAKAKIEKYEADAEEAKLDTLAASRMEEVEKLHGYDADERKDVLETLRTMDEKSFELLKKTLEASAKKGGVEEGARIRNPFESKEDADGAASELIGTDEWKRLVASASEKTEDK